MDFAALKPKPYPLTKGFAQCSLQGTPRTIKMMSWTGDLRCLYCDGKLPLFRKHTSGQFCSAQHRKLYWEEQERLGLERLHQTHNSPRAVQVPEEGPTLCGFLAAFTRPQPVWPSDDVKAAEP